MAAPLRLAVTQTLDRAAYEGRLRALEAEAYATIPHDVRGAAAVAKADADQLHAERIAEGEEEIDG